MGKTNGNEELHLFGFRKKNKEPIKPPKENDAKNFDEFLAPIDGPNKDLNFAIKSGKKKIAGVINKLTLDFQLVSSADAEDITKQLFLLAANVDLNEKKSNQLLAAIGKFILKVSSSTSGANFVFRAWSERLISTDFSERSQSQIAFQWIMLLNQKDGSAISPQCLRQVFDESQAILVNIYNKILLTFDSQAAYKDSIGEQPGYKLLEKFACTYFYHSNKSYEHYESWILDSVSRNILFGNGLILSVLQRSENHPQVMVELLDLYVCSSIDKNHDGMAWTLFLDLFDVETTKPKDLSAIVEKMEPKIDSWSADQRSFAIEWLFLGRDTQKCKRLLVKSKGARQLASILTQEGNTNYVNELKALLNEKLEPNYTLPSGGEDQFIDINIKLMVINELMYIRKTLTPAFNIYEFAKAYDHREISVTGYEIIPEALDYMRGISIPQDLLSTIKELRYDASDEIYGNLSPFWDGEDDIFEANSLSDLEKLNNLESIDGFNEKLVDQFSSLLEKHNIQVQ
ncbi:DUF6892 domain-containing protein [Microbulbifer sp. ANSA003]|uniref:DUF6892 domain-containing protein n=1 Tax=Microbulbifer sp. ANSA003 TaxID=3243360 RepID=UPI0040431D97